MTESEALEALHSKLPSQRMHAASWFAERAEGGHLEQLVRARDAEPVPRVRAVLSAAVRRLTSGELDGANRTSLNRAPVDITDALSILNGLAGVIRHEMAAAIGWARYSASKEIEGFATSRTNAAFDALIKRMEGLVAIAEANRPPLRRPVSISELLVECLPPQLPRSLVDLHAAVEDLDLIETDPGLMGLILSNALNNAAEATLNSATPGQVFISYGTGDRDFYVTVSNSFAGQSFRLDDVLATGVTSKREHRGLGVYVMKLSAEKLGYDFTLSADGGVATFSLRGRKRG